jgi:O-antigen ligase
VLTGSRGALFSIIFIFILYTFDVLIRERKINYKLLVLSLYFLVIFLFNSLVPVSLYSRFINNDFITNEFLNPYSRTNIWKTIMNNIIPEMPFLGYGSGNAYFIVGEYMGIPLSSHNLIFDILLQFGFLGVIIFLSFLISLFLFLLKYKQHHLIFAFIGILLVTIFLEGLSKKYFWNVIIFSVLTNHNFSIKEI